MPAARKILKWTGITLGGVLLAIVCGAFLVNTDMARGYILKIVVQRAQQTAGQAVGIRAIAFHWFPLRVKFSGIQVGGVSAAVKAPLLTLDSVEVGIGIGILHRPNVRLRSVVLDHPVLHLYTDAQGRIVTGQRHAAVASKGGNPAQQFFDLGIDDATVKNGEVYFDDRPASVSAEAHDLALDLSRAFLAERYDGSLRYDRGVFQVGGHQPFPHNLAATFQATPGTLSVKSLSIETGTSRLTASAGLSNFSRPVLRGSYEASLSANQLSAIVSEPNLRVGAVVTQGAVSYAADPAKPFLDNLQITGKLTGSDFALASPSVSAPIRDVAAEYELTQGNVYVRQVQFAMLGGQLTGSLIADNISSDVQVRGDAGIRGLSLVSAASGFAAQFRCAHRVGHRERDGPRRVGACRRGAASFRFDDCGAEVRCKSCRDSGEWNDPCEL